MLGTSGQAPKRLTLSASPHDRTVPNSGGLPCTASPDHYGRSVAQVCKCQTHQTKGKPACHTVPPKKNDVHCNRRKKLDLHMNNFV